MHVLVRGIPLLTPTSRPLFRLPLPAATPGDNYACLTCKWYWRYDITPPQTQGTGTNCRCSTDTAWAFPREYCWISWMYG